MINHMVLQGRFTKDIELLNSSKSETKYVRFSIAWNEKLKNGGEITLFLNCITYNHLAEFIAKYFKKGDMVVVEGKLLSNNYEDQQGNKKYENELKVHHIHFCN